MNVIILLHLCFFQLIGHELLVYELKYSKKFSLTVNPKYTDTRRHNMIYSNFLIVKMRHRNNNAVQKIEKSTYFY